MIPALAAAWPVAGLLCWAALAWIARPGRARSEILDLLVSPPHFVLTIALWPLFLYVTVGDWKEGA